MGNIVTKNWASAKEGGRFSGSSKMFTFSIFPFSKLPLGCVFDVNVAEPPVRCSEFYQRKQTRNAGLSLCWLPNREEIHNRPLSETQI